MGEKHGSRECTIFFLVAFLTGTDYLASHFTKPTYTFTLCKSKRDEYVLCNILINMSSLEDCSIIFIPLEMTDVIAESVHAVDNEYS